MGIKLEDVRVGERIVLNGRPGRIYTLLQQSCISAWLLEVCRETAPVSVGYKNAEGEAVLVHGEVIYTNEANCMACGGRLKPLPNYCGWPASTHVITRPNLQAVDIFKGKKNLGSAQ